ncbi:MAG: AAA-like domain-containing protein [Cyanobacteria bacterium J06635_15]
MSAFPSGTLPLNSPYYIQRPPLETLAYDNIKQPGSITRIKAPRQMGKSSLLLRLLAQARTQEYRTVSIDFQAADTAVYDSLSKFLRWFCATVSRQLHLPIELDYYWDDDIGDKISCTFYFEAYLLEQIETPIVIAFDEVNQVFEHPEIAKDFFPLLRYWHEQAKHLACFQKLRMVVAHSTEVYVPLSIHQSPFNVGVPIQLDPFDCQQIQALAQHYGITQLSESEFDRLTAMVGGHPYLLSLAFYHLQHSQCSLAELLKTAPTQSGVYSHHLRSQLDRVIQQPRLASALKQVVTSPSAVEIDAIPAYQLASLGLVRLVGNRGISACNLYRQYFATQALIRNLPTPRLQQLEQENAQLKTLVNLDSLTGIANRRYFDERLAAEWQRLAARRLPLSLILFDVDYFKGYNDTYGHPAGDRCLQQIARTLRGSLKNPNHLVARYGGEEFAVLLPTTDLYGTQQLAYRLLENIAALKIAHVTSLVATKVVTASLGVASITPQPHRSPESLIAAADEALYQAKHLGRNRVIVNSQHAPIAPCA